MNLRLLGVCALLASPPLIAQRVTEFTIPTAASQPGGITAGPDGNVWFTESAGNKVARITPAGVITEFSSGLTASASPSAITNACEGNLWFSEPAVSKVGRVTPSGTITEFATTNGVSPRGIVCFDGFITYAEYLGNAIGLMSITGGAPTDLGADLPSSGPWGIARGLDDQIWYSERSSNAVAYLNVYTSDHLSYTLPTASSLPEDVVYAADGTLWVTEAGHAKLYALPLNGGPREVILSAAAGGLALGARGEVWATEPSVNKIARVTPPSTVTEYTLPTASAAPTHIAFGGDGNLWITENGVNKIARFVPDVLGDVNADGLVNVNDVFYLINFLFAGGTAPKF